MSANTETAPFRHTADMGEISGFGGGYEACCQDMLEAGVLWLNANPQKRDLSAHGLQNVYGIFIPDSDDAKAIEKAIIDASKGEATGAMHHAVMSRLFYIAKNGWDSYCEELRKPRDENDEAEQ
jgi:hypothetical protein